MLLFAVLIGSNCSWAEDDLAGRTDKGLYRLALAPQSPPVRLRVPQAWTLRVTTTVGATFLPTQLVVDAGMPGHGHGLASQPVVTRYLGDGVFLVEGVTFNMAGPWVFRIALAGPDGADSAMLDFELDTSGGLSAADTAQSMPSDAVLLGSFQLDGLGLPSDPSNRYVDDRRAQRFGHRLFFDMELSGTGTVSCASCHDPGRLFTDGLKRARGVGQTQRNTPDLVGVAHRTWLYWDGRRDSLWSQALIPLEASEEMGSSRVAVLKHIGKRHRTEYEALFGSLPRLDRLPDHAAPIGSTANQVAWETVGPDRQLEINAAFANLGKAIGAYESTLAVAAGRFDAYLAAALAGDPEAESLLTPAEREGLGLFLDVDRTLCLRCHNGPLFSNQGFHNVGTGSFEGAHMDFGRVLGLQAALVTEFNCLGPYSDAGETDCAAIRFAHRQHVPSTFTGAFKVPSLRNVAQTGPYMHDGRFESLAEVLEHYRNPPPQAVAMGEIAPVALTDSEIDALIAFLGALDGGVDADPQWLSAPDLEHEGAVE